METGSIFDCVTALAVATYQFSVAAPYSSCISQATLVHPVAVARPKALGEVCRAHRSKAARYTSGGVGTSLFERIDNRYCRLNENILRDGAQRLHRILVAFANDRTAPARTLPVTPHFVQDQRVQEFRHRNRIAGS